jgi:hypothetical protein
MAQVTLRIAVVAAVSLVVGCGGSAPEPVAPLEKAAGWRLLPPAPLVPRDRQATVVVGRRMLVLGGGNLDAWRGRGDRRERAGYSYNPETRKTTQLVSEWYSDGAFYDPQTNRWQAAPPLLQGARGAAAAFWTGKEVLVWGGVGERWEPRRDGAAYKPTTGRRRTIAPHTGTAASARRNPADVTRTGAVFPRSWPNHLPSSMSMSRIRAVSHQFSRLTRQFA